jgi:hypothetical protein
MPANLSPEYKVAEAAYRKARDPKERLLHLREMLRVIPKHKGTEHLQADIKARVKDLTGELEHGPKGGSRSGPALVVRPEGAAQIALIGPPNAGKSLLHARLTGSHAHDAPYPFTTQYPEPGMMPCADIHTNQPADRLRGWRRTRWPTPMLVLNCGPLVRRAVGAAHRRCRDRALGGPRPAATTGREPTTILRLGCRRCLSNGLGWRRCAAGRHRRRTADLGRGRARTHEIGPWPSGRPQTVHPSCPASTDPASFTLRQGPDGARRRAAGALDLERTLRCADRPQARGQHVGPGHVLADGDVVELHG